MSKNKGYGYFYPLNKHDKDAHEMKIMQIVPKFLEETHNYKQPIVKFP